MAAELTIWFSPPESACFRQRNPITSQRSEWKDSFFLVLGPLDLGSLSLYPESLTLKINSPSELCDTRVPTWEAMLKNNFLASCSLRSWIGQLRIRTTPGPFSSNSPAPESSFVRDWVSLLFPETRLLISFMWVSVRLICQSESLEISSLFHAQGELIFEKAP